MNSRKALRLSAKLLWACLFLPSALLAQNWILQHPTLSPTARTGSSMVYDIAHHQTLLFGGADASGNPLAETWVYNGTTWTNATPPGPSSSPTSRLWAGMAYDVDTQTVILYGGCAQVTCSTYLADTWEWNGSTSTWTYKPLGGTPGPRRGAALAWGPQATVGGVVMTGGYNGSTTLGDIYIWDGTEWNTPESNTPAAREFGTMSYDPDAGELVLFGGDDGATPANPLQDTWVWDGTGWAQFIGNAHPTPRSNPSSAWDPVRRRVVLFGGGGMNDTWLYMTGSWTQEVTTTSPTGRFYGSMVYDTQHAQAVLFGGQSTTSTSSALADTWALGYSYSQNWMQMNQANAPLSPAARTGASAAPFSGEIVMFGGYDGTANRAETWVWGGNEWGQLSSSGPTARNGASMTYDAVDGKLLLFGGESGISGNGLLQDTWLFDGLYWNPVPTNASPTARDGAAMAYDGADQYVLLFGGFGGTGDDTWTYKSATWTHQNPGTVPTGRSDASMVFDQTRNQIVMFGGFTIGTGVPLADTWVWNGNNWVLLSPAHSPSPRGAAVMVYDSVHGTVLLFGGQQFDDMNDTWQWDGVDWTQLSPSTSPTFLENGAAGYLPTQGLVMFGGQSNGTVQGQTWVLGSPFVNPALPTAFASQSYGYTIVPSGGVAPYTFTQDGQPTTFAANGMTFNAATGAISGTALNEEQASTIGVTITDSQGQSQDVAFELVTDNAITFNPNPPSDATASATYSYQLTATGGTGPFTYSVQGGPSWLSVNSSGVLTATACTASTSASYSLVATDSVNGSATAGSFTINCNPAPQITPASLPPAQYGSYYYVALNTNAVYDSPGASPYAWTVSAGSLPAGLTLDPMYGEISGTPTAAGTVSFTVKFTDAWGAFTTKPFQIPVALSFNSANLPTGVVGVAYPATTLSASGGTAPYTFSVTGLAAGLTLNTNGAIVGTPTTATTYSANFTVHDSASNSGAISIPIYVVQPGTNPEDWVPLAPAFSPADRSNNSMFYDSVRSKVIMFGGNGDTTDLGDTLSWDGTNWTTAATSGPAPRGGAATAFDPVHQQGVLFGGYLNGSYQSDTWLWNGTSWSQPVPAHPPQSRTNAMMAWDGHHIVLYGGSIGDGDWGDTLIWDGSDWTDVSPSPGPPNRTGGGMAYDPVHDKVLLFGGYDAESNNEFSDTWIWDGVAKTWTAAPPGPSPTGREGVALGFDSQRNQIVLFGGFDGSNLLGDTWTWNGSSWSQLTTLHAPSPRSYFGMTFDTATSNMVLFGGSGATSNLNDTWVLGGPSITGGTLPPGVEGTQYNDLPAEVGGVAPLTFLLSGAPAWMVVNPANGGLTGNPNAAGTTNFKEIAVDSYGVTSSANLSIMISPPSVPLSLVTTTLPDATMGRNYNVPLSATGGSGGYVFSVNPLPAGLSVNAASLTGICTAGATNITLMVTDSAMETASVSGLSVACNPPPSITTTSPLPNGVVNTNYSQTFQSSGGTAPIVWSVPPSALPSGFSLTPAGLLSGSSTTPVSATFNVTATDMWGATATLSFTFHIESAVSITTGSLPAGVQGSPYPNGVTLGVSGGSGNYAFSANLPAGLQIDPVTGAITGLPTASGIYQVTFQVTDPPQIATRQIPLQILANIGNPNWTNLSPAGPPSARDSYAMAFDPVRGVSVLYGGTGLGDTWTFQFPSTWTQKATSGPLAQSGAGMAWLASQSNMVLFGGVINATNQSQTWVWDGSGWTQKSVSPAPPARSFAGLAPDSAHNTVVLYGGTSGMGYANALQDTWTWDGTSWTPQENETFPAPAFGPSLADGPTGPVLFGGYDNTGDLLNQTWVWNGSDWFLKSPLISPPARAFAGMVFNSSTGVTILFGGTGASGALNDVWQWDGANWTQLNPATSPTARTNIALSYDSGSKQAILFGGANTPQPDTSDTWTFGFPAIVNTTLPAATAGANYTANVQLIGGTPPYIYFATGNPETFPAGLTLNQTTGQISGATQSVGMYSVGIKFGDAQIGTASIPSTLSLTVNSAGTLVLATNSLPDATMGTAYSASLSATGGVGAYTFSATGLPTGMQVTGSQITGQCTAGATQVMLMVHDSAVPVANTASDGPLTLKCNAPPSITTTPPLPNGIVNTNYSFTFQSSGGTGPITWSVPPSVLPTGFSLSPAGVLMGSSSTPFSVTFGVTATDHWGAFATVSFTLNIESTVTITSSSLPNGVQGSPYPTGVALAVSGGSGTYAFTANLPAGLQIDSTTGVITGVPTGSGISQVTFQVTDQTQTVSRTIPLQILSNTGNPNWTNLNPGSPPSARDSYSLAFDAAHGVSVLYGGTGLGDTWTFQFPSTWTQKATSGPLAQSGAGMAWMASQNNMVLFGGLINATNQAQTWVWDGSTWTQKSPSLAPTARSFAGMAPDSAHNTVLLYGGTSGSGFANALQDTWTWDGTGWTHQPTATFPAPAFAPALADGPTGPVLFGGYDNTGDLLNQTWVWSGTDWSLKSPVISPPARAFAGMVYNSKTGVTVLFGGQGVSGALQDVWQWDGANWIQLNPAASPSARTHIALAYDSTVNQAILFGGANTPQPDTSDTWTFGFPALINATLPTATAGANYTTNVQLIGGTPPYNYFATGNPQTLPSGLTLDQTTGQISGATQSVGTYSVGVAFGDLQTATASIPGTLSLTVSSAGTLVLATTTLPNATMGTAYSAPLSATGGVGAYTFSATGLPAGLQVSGSQITGMCTAGSAQVMLMVHDSAVPVPNTATGGTLTVQCNAPPSFITTSPLPTGVVGTPYTVALQASGGTAPIVWSALPNSLPTGFQLSSAGVLSGTASSPVSATFNLTISDLWGAGGSKSYSLTIDPVLSITTVSLVNGTAGVAYPGATLAATGGSGKYSFSAVSGLPAGYSVNPQGAVSGTTTQTGSFMPIFKVMDQDGQAATAEVSLNVLNGSGITILSPTALPTGAIGQQYTYQFHWSGGVSPTSIASSSLPSWLVLNASTGNLTGTPLTGGIYTFPITVTDSQSPPNSATQTETIIVSPPSVTTVSPLAEAYVGIPYSNKLTAGSGTSPYSFSSANLPTWLALASDGTLSGTPPPGTPASVSFDVTVTDSLGAYSTGTLTLPVLSTPTLYFQTVSPLASATPGLLYSVTLQGGGGNGVFNFSATGLPSWLALNSKTHVLSGTPPAAGPVTFQITLSDNVNQSISQYFTLPVNGTLLFDTPATLPPASVGLPYSETLLASGGSGTYSWTASGLPSWLSLSSAGVFSGTPTQAGPFTFRITVTDSQSHTLSRTFTLAVVSSLTIETASPLAPATANFPYSLTLAAAGGAGSYSWTGNSLPPGFNVTPNGVLTGIAQSAATLSLSVTVQDASSNAATQVLSLPVNSAVTLNLPTLPQGVVQVPYYGNLTASGGVPGYTFTATGLPAWLSLSQAGYLSGTPTAAGPVTIQVTVTDSQQNSTTLPIPITVNPALSITTSSLPSAGVNTPYTTALSAVGGIAPLTWSSTNLPAGLQLSTAGVLSGTVTKTGVYSLTVTVWDSGTSLVSQPFQLVVSTGVPLSFVSAATLPTCLPNAFCSNQIVASGGVPPYIFSVAPNANLGGLSLSASGLLSGTPNSGGAISVPVILTDQQNSISATFTQPVIASLSIVTGSLPGGTVGVKYGAGLTAAGGNPPYTWSLVAGSGSLPAGLTLDSFGGDIVGTPTAAGTATFSLQVSDGQQTSAPQQLSIAIAAVTVPTSLSIASPAMLTPGMVGTLYGQTLMASGGSGSYTWTLTSGALPTGLSLSPSGAITGTPTAAQTASFTAVVNDIGGNSLPGAFTLVVASSNTVSLITPNPLPDGAQGVPYNYAINVLGGTPPYFYSIVSGQVPPGLTFDATNGTLSGTPTQSGSFDLVLNVTDSGGSSASVGGGSFGKPSAHAVTSNNYTIHIAAVGAYQITTAPNLPIATMGTAYSTAFAASGGATPYIWSLVLGNMPAGLTLTPGGTISGTPTQAGLSSLVVKATDATGAVATGAFVLQVVNPNVPTINPVPPLPPGTVGQSYTAALTAVGGHTPYIWSIPTGSLPPGVTLNSQGGSLSGTPTSAGNYPFTAQVVDARQIVATQNFTLRVNALNLQISPATIPPATANLLYTEGLSVSGGTAPYNWSLSAGGLLSSFTIDPATGQISGTPTVPGTYMFTISVVDSNFGIGMQTYQFVVQNATAALSIGTTTLAVGTVGAAYDVGLTAVNSAPPLTWTIQSGTLPTGIQLAASTGILAGTPSQAGSYPITVQVADSTGATAQKNFTLTVSAPPLTIVTAALPGGALGTAYSQTILTAGGTGALTWSISSGTLPGGLTLGATTGIVSGTPSASGTFSFAVKAIDSLGVTAQQFLSVTIAPPPALPSITVTGLPATSKPGDQPTVTLTLLSAYPLPITATATLSVTPSHGSATDLMFANGTRTATVTIPANSTTATLQFQTGTLPGTIQITFTFSAAGVDITPTTPPSSTTTIAATAPTISSVKVISTSSGIQVTVVGTSTTLDMKTATFQFTPAAGATLQTTTVTLDVSSLFTTWYASAASAATGSQFSLAVPFTITGNVSSIASVSVTLTNSAGTSAAVSANVP
ncbi:MAG TPA: putative Ig domain-containing protein [Bryobacteraceae bacterium]|nr:putative Ig domain-containing protein [Bryobacteraceae bacterium]